MLDSLTDSGTDLTDLLRPLNSFYESWHHALPHVQRVAPAEMPEPYRRLLVHSRDMTSTLEEFFNETMNLTVLHSDHANGSYSREILLVGARSGRVVEYGSIRIFLENFDPKSRAEILSETLPLGTVMTRNAVQYVSAPSDFFEIQSDDIIGRHFKLSAATKLYGRRNKHSTPSGATLADIVEVLPPISVGRSSTPSSAALEVIDGVELRPTDTDSKEIGRQRN